MTLPTRLLDGYASFRSGRYASEAARYERLGQGSQKPSMMIIACCDSARPPKRYLMPGLAKSSWSAMWPIWFRPTCRTGAITRQSAALDFAVLALGVKHVVVMGHGRCGGIHAAVQDANPLTHTDFIAHGCAVIKDVARYVTHDHSENEELFERRVERASVEHSLANMRTFPWIRLRENAGHSPSMVPGLTFRWANFMPTTRRRRRGRRFTDADRSPPQARRCLTGGGDHGPPRQRRGALFHFATMNCFRESIQMTQRDLQGNRLTGASAAAASAYGDALRQLSIYAGDPLSIADGLPKANRVSAWPTSSRPGCSCSKRRQGRRRCARGDCKDRDSGSRQPRTGSCRGDQQPDRRPVSRGIAGSGRRCGRTSARSAGAHCRSHSWTSSPAVRNCCVTASCAPCPPGRIPFPAIMPCWACRPSGLRKLGDYVGAEASGRAALEIERCEGLGRHAVAHVMEMQSRQDEGIAFMREDTDSWTTGSFLRFTIGGISRSIIWSLARWTRY